MKHFVALAMSFALLAGCQEENSAATVETSPGGIEYARLSIPQAEDVAIQIAWPSDWARREGVNQAVPYIAADLILAGGAEGFPPGEVVETFADLKAEGSLWITADNLHGQLIAPVANLDKAVEIAAAHLAKPTLDQSWFDRIQQGFAANMAEASAQPATQVYGAARWAILGDTPLRRALSVDPTEMITSATRADVQDWQAQTLTRTGIKVVIAGPIDAATAGKAVDALLLGLPEGKAHTTPPAKPNFAPKRILLHVPSAQTSTLTFLGPLPPTRDGSEFEDIILATSLGGSDNSVLFDAVRTGLRASYGFSAFLDGYNRDSRLLALSGEVETAKLAQAETIVRDAYAAFLKAPNQGSLADRKAMFQGNVEQSYKDPVASSYSAMMAILDGQDASMAFKLNTLLDSVSEDSLAKRASTAFPAADSLVVVAVSPDASALPGACVITSPAEAVNCP